MAKMKVSPIVKAPLADVWKSWEDFGNIYKFHPGLKAIPVNELKKILIQ